MCVTSDSWLELKCSAMSVSLQVCGVFSLSVCAEFCVCPLQLLCISRSGVVYFVFSVSVVSWLIQNSSGTCVNFLGGVYAVQCV